MYICAVPIECNRFSTTSELAHSAEYFIVNTPLIWNGFENKPIRMQFENTDNDGKFCMHKNDYKKFSFIFFNLKLEYFQLRWGKWQPQHLQKERKK